MIIHVIDSFYSFCPESDILLTLFIVFGKKSDILTLLITCLSRKCHIHSFHRVCPESDMFFTLIPVVMSSKIQ